MKMKNEAGFSIVEMLCVLTCLSVITAISVNYYIKAKISAENTSAIATLSLMRQNEVIYYTQRQRFARLDELHYLHGNLGTIQDDLTLTRGPFKYDLTTTTGTPTPSDPRNLATDYLITATRITNNAVPYVFTLDQSGTITKVLPVEGSLGEN
ncbi:MAG: type II secretion system GspH family protein [Acidobacteriota bacterium]|nr:type II secretion system GspH family protein [Acidobacteriota bacterium]